MVSLVMCVAIAREARTDIQEPCQRQYVQVTTEGWPMKAVSYPQIYFQIKDN